MLKLYVEKIWKPWTVDGWQEGWMDGWMEAKAGLRIAYSNQKYILTVTLQPKMLDNFDEHNN